MGFAIYIYIYVIYRQKISLADIARILLMLFLCGGLLAVRYF